MAMTRRRRSTAAPSTSLPPAHERVMSAYLQQKYGKRTELKGSRFAAHADRTAVLYAQCMPKVPEAGDSDKARVSLSSEPMAPSWQLPQSLNLIPSSASYGLNTRRLKDGGLRQRGPQLSDSLGPTLALAEAGRMVARRGLRASEVRPADGGVASPPS